MVFGMVMSTIAAISAAVQNNHRATSKLSLPDVLVRPEIAAYLPLRIAAIKAVAPSRSGSMSIAGGFFSAAMRPLVEAYRA
jgi:hypothetical protein